MKETLITDIDTSNLTEGQEIKNYRALCELLGENTKTGNAKKAQIKEWERYFLLERINGTQKMIVRKLYVQPKQKRDKRSDGIYVKSIELILLCELAKMRGYTAVFTKNRLLQRLGMINANYKKIPANELKNLDECISDFEINHFYQRADSRLNKILTDALKSLKNRYIIDYTTQYRIIDGRGNRRVAQDLDIKNILTLKKKALCVVNCKNEQEVFLKFKTSEFYKTLNHYYAYYFDWQYVYKEYKLVFNQNIVKDEIPVVEIELQKELLNTDVAKAIQQTAVQNFTAHKEKLPKLYLKAQSLLIDTLIRLDVSNNKVADNKVTKAPIFMLGTEEENEIRNELDAVFGL